MVAYSAPMYRARLLGNEQYAARTDLQTNVDWKGLGGGKIVSHLHGKMPRSPATLSIVGTVSHGGASLAPEGTYSRQFNNMDKARWVIVLDEPDDDEFSGDYKAALKNLLELQGKVTQAGNPRDLFVDKNKSLRFVQRLFERHSHDDEAIPSNASSDDPADADYIPTAGNWPIPAYCKGEFDKQVREMTFKPLLVHDLKADRRPYPKSFASCIPGALVEIRFILRHWIINDRERNQVHDSVNAVIQEIIILNVGRPMSTQGYRIRALDPALRREQRQAAKLYALGYTEPEIEDAVKEKSVLAGSVNDGFNQADDSIGARQGTHEGSLGRFLEIDDNNDVAQGESYVSLGQEQDGEAATLSTKGKERAVSQRKRPSDGPASPPKVRRTEKGRDNGSEDADTVA